MEHISDLVLIEYAKKCVDDEEKLTYIFTHLLECELCFHRFRDILHLHENFDQVFDQVFPDPVGEVLEWVVASRKFIERSAGKALERVEQKIKENEITLVCLEVRYMKNAAGETDVEGPSQLLYGDGSVDLAKMEIGRKANLLKFYSPESTGYKNAVLTGPGLNPVYALIAPSPKGGFHFSFKVSNQSYKYLITFY